MGRIGCVRCEKSRCDFMAQTFALIAPIHPVLHRVSFSYEMIPTAPKHYGRHQNMSLGSNGVDQVRLLGKITMWLRGRNFCINCTSSVCFAPSFMQLRNNPKCTQTLWMAPKHEFRVQWVGSGAFVAKNYNMTVKTVFWHASKKVIFVKGRWPIWKKPKDAQVGISRWSGSDGPEEYALKMLIR